MTKESSERAATGGRPKDRIVRVVDLEQAIEIKKRVKREEEEAAD